MTTEENDIFLEGFVADDEQKEVDEISPKPASKKTKLPKKDKIETKIYNIVKNRLLLKDDKGNWYSLPIGESHKNAKIGDVIYL